MKRLAWFVVLIPFAVCLLGYLAVSFATAAPPLSLEGLLDEKLPEAPKKDDTILADNQACFVCHANYDEEPLAVSHSRQDVGCIDCHGESLEHRDDEDNVTPPDNMYALDDVDAMCGECHDEHIASAADVIARWQQRCPKKTDPSQIVCTDCHFQHRLKFRTVWWNKKTRQLVIRKEGERTKPAEELK